VSLDGIADTVAAALEEIQTELYQRGKAYLDAHTADASTFDELVRLMERLQGFVKVGWCETQRCEDAIREKTGASPRVIPLDDQATGTCVVCGNAARVWVYYARAY
jgi:prolyl-tRNA synthetase